MRLLLAAFLALPAAARASEFTRLAALADGERDPSIRLQRLAQAVSAWRAGDDKRALGVRYDQLGSLHLAASRKPEALSAYERAMELLPAEPMPRNNRGSVLLGLHRFDEALADFKHADRAKPDEPMFLGNICQTLLSMDRPAEGLPYCERAIRLQPSKVAINTVWNAALTYALLRRRDEAVRMQATLRSRPEDPMVLLCDGVIALLDGREKDGETAFATLMEKQPKELANHLIWRGRIRLLRKEYAKAFNDFDKAYALDKGMLDALVWRARVHEQAGRPASAAHDFSEACKRGWKSACKRKRE